MQTCASCGESFEMYPVVEGTRLNLRGRTTCLSCRPLRHLRGPRRSVVRARSSKICEACGRSFPTKLVIDGKMRSLHRRRFCLTCSPFAAHNTSRRPHGVADMDVLRELRRRRRNATTYRSQKARRRARKAELVAARGGACADCGYAGSVVALDFHHRDGTSKEFGIAKFDGSLERLLVEAQKCDLVCANCHRLRHAASRAQAADRLSIARQALKVRAVEFMGGACNGCGGRYPPALLDFHHRVAKEKVFGISQDGVLRSWPRIVAELAKCVMLCANCHREVHAGIRALDDRTGLAEDALPYAA